MFRDDDDSQLHKDPPESGGSSADGEEQPTSVEEEAPTYDGPRASDEDRQQMATDPVLRASLRGWLRKHLPESDVDDVLQEVVVAAHRSPNLPAGDGAARDQYVHGIARRLRARFWRSHAQLRAAKKETKENLLLSLAAPVDLVAERDLVAKITAVPNRKQADLTCLIRHKVGKESLVDLARERNEKYDAFAKRIARLEKKILEAGKALGGMFVLLLAVAFGRDALTPVPGMNVDHPGPAGLPPPAVSTHVLEVDPIDRAKVMRADAFRACMDNEWQECLDGLDSARLLDPDGDDDPMVQAARRDAFDASFANLKPGSQWRPPPVRVYAPRASHPLR